MKRKRIVSILIVSSLFIFCNTDAKENNVNIQCHKEKNKTELSKLQKEKTEVNKFVDCKMGSKSDDVKTVQHLLNSYGFNIKEDGAFGQNTYNSLKNFQRIFGISCTGNIDMDTYKQLTKNATEEDVKKVTAFKTEYISQNSAEDNANKFELASMTDYLIYVDIPNQIVNILNGYQYHWKLIKTMSCASGASDTPTVRGVFEIASKGEVFRPSSGVMCKYYSQFWGNYLFHSILLDNNGNVIDPTLGRKASHGCIRLAIEDAKYIYTDMPQGTTVWIK